MVRPPAFLLSAVALCVAVVASAEPASAPATEPPATSPATAADPWLATLTPLLAEHYKPAGELALSWARARPAYANPVAGLALVSCPADLASQLLVTVRATEADGRTAERTLLLRVELWREGWVLREPAGTGGTLRAGQLDLRRFDALRERDSVTADPALDLVFARNVPAGRLLVWRDLAKRPLVRRGQTVEVAATEGPITVTLRAFAMQDAARGEPVRVRNPETNKEFTAVVTAEARAAVSF